MAKDVLIVFDRVLHGFWCNLLLEEAEARGFHPVELQNYATAMNFLRKARESTALVIVPEDLLSSRDRKGVVIARKVQDLGFRVAVLTYSRPQKYPGLMTFYCDNYKKIFSLAEGT